MKKTLIFAQFCLVFAVSIFYIVANFGRIETDIFALVKFDENGKEKILLKELTNELGNDFLLASNSSDLLNKAKNLADKSGLFTEFNAGLDLNLSLYKAQLNELKLAVLDEKIYNQITLNPSEFFSQNARNFFNQFAFKPLNAKDDFFALAAHNSLNSGGVGINLSTMMLEAKDGEDSFFIAKAKLKQGFSGADLIKFYESVRGLSAELNAKSYMHSAALYSAFAKARGDRESLYMSVVSLTLVWLFLLAAFRKFSVFYIVLVALFGFAVGLCASLLVFSKVHITVVIIGTSLVGLMFDFALHWLGKSLNLAINSASIKAMLPIFLLGLFITIGGYGVFLFAPLEMLRQIAIFSSFTLFGAFLFTYFCLPLLLEGRVFSQSAKFSLILDKIVSLCLRLAPKFSARNIAVVIILAFAFLILSFKNLAVKDNIKEYAASPEFLLAQSVKISKLTAQDPAMTAVVIKSSGDMIGAQKALLSQLASQNLYQTQSSLAKLFLSKEQQESVKRAFAEAKNSDEILKFYLELGFNKDDLRAEFDKTSSLKTLSASEILNFSALGDLKRFVLDENTSVIYLGGFVKNEKSSEILARNGAFSVDFAQSLNENLTKTKTVAVILKIIAFGIAFALLWVFFGLKKSLWIMSLIALGTAVTLCAFVIFGVHINIFAVFGLILASAVGIDYMIFALNDKLSQKERIFGIFSACVTSFVSFFALFFSATAAISVFGLGVSVCIAIYGILAMILSVKSL